MEGITENMPNPLVFWNDVQSVRCFHRLVLLLAGLARQGVYQSRRDKETGDWFDNKIAFSQPLSCTSLDYLSEPISISRKPSSNRPGNQLSLKALDIHVHRLPRSDLIVRAGRILLRSPLHLKKSRKQFKWERFISLDTEIEPQGGVSEDENQRTQIQELLICYVLGIRRGCQRCDRIIIIITTPRDSPIFEMTIPQFNPSLQLSVLI